MLHLTPHNPLKDIRDQCCQEICILLNRSDNGVNIFNQDSSLLFFTQVGCALGFLLPPLIVDDFLDSSEIMQSSTATISNDTSSVMFLNATMEQKINYISYKLNILLYGGATVSTLLLILVFLCNQGTHILL